MVATINLAIDEGKLTLIHSSAWCLIVTTRRSARHSTTPI